MWRKAILVLLTTAITAPFDAGPSASAQEADEPEDQAPRERAVRRRIGFRVSGRCFFGADGDDETACRIAEARLRSRIASIDRSCEMSREQRKKLELAGRGDIKRFFDRVREIRARIQAADHDIALYNELVKEAQELGQAFRTRPCDEGSLFAKMLRRTLEPAQTALYQEKWHERRLLDHQARVAWVARTLQKELSMSDGERLRLFAVLLEETHPPRNSGPADSYGILYQASRIPEGKLRPILDEIEWRRLGREFDEARRREPMLRRSGLVTEDFPGLESARREPWPGHEHPGQSAAADRPRTDREGHAL